ncbi:MAG: enoyl-CoA hydratase/isomerase family protein, partial [Desulfobacterales bacterium]|nr:enoyl-CoA hydratase/isomerase family protein [Desulfobacterales bacterium]
MHFDCIIYGKDAEIATIRLNRPHVLNAMNKQMWLELQAALEIVKNDPEIKAVVFTGEGRAFSTGADMKETKDRSLEAYRDYLTELQEASRKIIRFEKATIAAINGYALGSGYELALACDIRIAAEEAQIGSPEAKVSSSITGGALRLIQDLIGPAKARELLFTGEYISGKEAARIGLVNKAVPLAQLSDEARSMARKIAANAAFSIKMIKKGLLMARGEVSLEALMDFEIEACLACVSTQERQASLVLLILSLTLAAICIWSQLLIVKLYLMSGLRGRYSIQSG